MLRILVSITILATAARANFRTEGLIYASSGFHWKGNVVACYEVRRSKA